MQLIVSTTNYVVENMQITILRSFIQVLVCVGFIFCTEEYPIYLGITKILILNHKMVDY